MASAALLNLYRQIEAGEVDLAAAPEPHPDVPGLDPFFGCDPGWSPERESGPARVEVCCTLTPQEVVVVYSCPLCRDGANLPRSLVCMRCLRSRHDREIAVILAEYPPPGPDAGG